MRRAIVGLAASLAFLAGAMAGAQQGQPPPANGVIIGTVIDGVTKKPVPGAVVTLGARGVAQPPVQVGSDGRFVFRDLPPGTYSPSATRNGYIGGGTGQRTPAGPRRPVDLGDVDSAAQVTLSLWRPSVVTGRITDERGEPAVALRVSLLHRVLENGEWRLRERYSTRSDDRGIYRFSKLEPSQYVVIARQDPEAFMESVMTAMAADMSALMSLVTAAMGSGREPELDFRARVIPTTFAPGTMTANEAETITLKPGEERAGVDIRVVYVPTFRIAGSVNGPEGAPPNLSVQLTSPSLNDLPAGLSIGNTGRGSQFDFAGVPAGEYVLRMFSVPRPTPQGARGGGGAAPGGAGGPGRATTQFQAAPEAPTWWAEQPITISDRDETTISVFLKQGVRISGRLQFDGSAAPAAFERFAIFLEAIDGLGVGRTNIPAAVKADGTFRSVGLPPGRYLLRLAGNVPPWRLKSVRAGGKDVTDIPIVIEGDDVTDGVITVSDQAPAVLQGTVRTGAGQPEKDATVVVFPVDRQFWAHLAPTSQRFKTSPVSSAGTYFVGGLPEGEYYVLADREDVLTDWLQIKVLEGLALRATRIQISPGDHKVQDLTRSGG